MQGSGGAGTGGSSELGDAMSRLLDALCWLLALPMRFQAWRVRRARRKAAK
jgi:hypothetical protein